jgi:hypothetical protein
VKRMRSTLYIAIVFSVLLSAICSVKAGQYLTSIQFFDEVMVSHLRLDSARAQPLMIEFQKKGSGFSKQVVYLKKCIVPIRDKAYKKDVSIAPNNVAAHLLLADIYFKSWRQNEKNREMQHESACRNK